MKNSFAPTWQMQLKQECHLSLPHHSSPWEKGCITDCCGAERRTRFSFLLSIMFPGSAIYITSSPSMSKQTCTMQHSQNSLLEALLPTLPIYLSPNFRENCCRRKKKIRWATFMILHPVIKDSWTINGTYTPVQCTGWSRCTLSCQLYI